MWLKKTFPAALGVAALLASVFAVLDYALSVPVVEFSYSTGECIKVIGADGAERLCSEQMPEKYDSVWIK